MTLTAQDRCDRCSAQAFVVWSRDNLALQFCRHHSVKFGPDLLSDEWAVTVDESDKINERPSVSANAES